MRLGLKFALVIGMALAILVPLLMIRGAIAERQGYRNAVVADVATHFGGRQVVAGPVLVVPYEENEVVEGGGARRVVRRVQRQWTFFPDTLQADGELKPDLRRRGLHEVRVYQWRGQLQARFDARIPDDGAGLQRTIGRPWLSVGIADVRGLVASPRLHLGDAVLPVAQGLGHADGPGVHARLAAPAAGARLAFETRLAMDLRGTEGFALLPLARENSLQLRSRWPHPKFEGLSPRHDTGADGFRAQWKVASVASNAQRRYLQQPSLAVAPLHAGSGRVEVAMPAGMPVDDAVGVTLVDPVNPYLQADRASKYGLLFVALTFVAFFMFELVKQVPIHPIQYLLVGLALAIFFLLLLSLSEHFAFGWSYLAAACACIGLIAFYLSAVLRSAARGIGFGAMLALLYAALYGLLLSEDNALALGAGLLFAVLAAVMVATRKLDWYQLAARAPSQDT